MLTLSEKIESENEGKAIKNDKNTVRNKVMKIEALKALKSDVKDDEKYKSVSKVKQLKLSFELKMSEISKDKSLPVSQAIKSKKLIFENVLESARKKIQRGPNPKAAKRVNNSGPSKLTGRGQ